MPVTSKNKKEPAKGTLESHAVLAGLKKEHGDQIGTFGHGYAPVGRLPSGIFPLDLAVGGGFPLFRISMIYGQESSGKTTTGLRLLGASQRYLKRTAVLIDAEHVYDPSWAQRFGIDTEKLIVIQPDNAEQAVDAVEGLLNADDVGIVLLDSLASMQPQKWIDAEPGKAAVGGNTQIVSALYRKVGSALTHQQKRDNPCAFVVLNQIRYKVGVMYGDPETTPGGMQAKHACCLQIRFYGKKVHEKDINPNMPAYFESTGTVRKWRVPIIGSSFEYRMCLAPHEGYAVGDIMGTWKTVSNRLQASGDLVKNGKEWHCLDQSAQTLDMLEGKYRSDPDWQLACQKKVLDKADLLDAIPFGKPKK